MREIAEDKARHEEELKMHARNQQGR